MIYIHPFEQVGGGVGWEEGGTAEQYRWGALAVRLGRHWDSEHGSPSSNPLSKSWSDWYDEMEEIEEELAEYASDIMGEEVRLAPEYI